MTSAMLAVSSQRMGYNTAVMDADITGPSIPKMFGIHSRAMGGDNGILPVDSKTGVQIMSMNVLLEREDEPVVWRGALISGTVLQFWTDVIWEDVDFMFVDMPPGTGDVPLTVFQSLPVDGVIVVTSPQDLVSMIVTKAVKMANLMHVPVLGIVENYSYLACPDCGKRLEVFGKSRIEEVAASLALPVLAKLPIDPAVAEAFDHGQMDTVDTAALSGAVAAIENMA